MSRMGFADARIDYVKVLVVMDWDLAQDSLRRLNVRVADEHSGLEEKRSYKVTVLGPTAETAGKNRYIVETWGDNALNIVHMMQPDWLEHLVRIDYRVPLTRVNQDALKHWAQKTMLGAKSRRNITVFNTKARTKTTTRDVGGHGIIIGSRKSDSHTVAYFRGDEVPAIEMRLQGGKAQDVGMAALRLFEEDGAHETLASALTAAVKTAAMVELNKSTGCLTLDHLQQDMVAAAEHMRRVQMSMDFQETEEERDYWDSLTTEQQEEMQQRGWVPDAMLKPKHRN